MRRQLSNAELAGTPLAHPSLVLLHINCEPSCLADTTLTLDVLALLAEGQFFCEWDSYLQLYVDGTKIDRLPPITAGLTLMASLSLGTLAIYDTDSVAIYLSELLPVSASFHVARKISLDDGGALPRGIAASMRTRRARWVFCGESLPSSSQGSSAIQRCGQESSAAIG